jgi:MFS family permease
MAWQVGCDWGLSSSRESLLSGVVFVGNMFGSNVWGIVADTHGRRPTFIAVTAFAAATSVLCAFARSYWVRLWHGPHAKRLRALVVQDLSITSFEGHALLQTLCTSGYAWETC